MYPNQNSRVSSLAVGFILTAAGFPINYCSAFTTTTTTTMNVPFHHCVRLGSPIKTTAVTATATATALHSHAIDAEDEAMVMMMRANNCAKSDTCSIEEAEEYLNEMLHIQSSCASGSLSSDLICEDVAFPSEVIAGLRQKIQNQVEMSNQGSAIKLGLNPVFLAVLVLYISSGLLSIAHNNPDAFTAQEWMYAAKGGYLDDLVSQYIKYGGLSPMTSVMDGAEAATPMVLPMTPQEWWWSLRDGYLGNMISEFQTHGGFLSTVDEGEGVATPFTTQEWSSAVKDGYLSDMIEHYMRNGGL